LQNAEQGIEPILRGMILQRAEEDDNFVVEDLTGNIFHNEMHFHVVNIVIIPELLF